MPKINSQNNHLIIPNALVVSLDTDRPATHWRGVFYAKERKYMLANDSDDLFRSLHKTHRILLKDKNIQGDKSIDIQGICIDHDLEIPQQEFSFHLDKVLKVLTIFF